MGPVFGWKKWASLTRLRSAFEGDWLDGDGDQLQETLSICRREAEEGLT